MIVVEDGTGVEGANSYVDREEATAYLEARGRDDWPADPADQEVHLIRGADYLNTVYTWGPPRSEKQTMGLPTINRSFIPPAIRTAQILLAYESSKGELVSTSTGPAVKKERKKLDGVGEKEVEYADNPLLGRTYPMVDLLVSGIAVSSSATAAVQVARRLVG